MSPNRWYCQYNGCGRDFGRREHLERHSLNHADGEFTCERCRAHFKRADLLERHIARHRRKDAEGSQLMTRKRLWKDASGNIVAKRPALDEGAVRSTKQASTSLRGTSQHFPPSPPGSASSIEPASAGLLNATGVANEEAVVAQEPYGTSLNTQIHDFDTDNLFWESSMPLAYNPTLSNELFDDIFLPDTASSFNMPYTTQNNYNWLFDMSLSFSSGHLQPQPQPHVPVAPVIGTNIATEQPFPSPATTQNSSTIDFDPKQSLPNVLDEHASLISVGSGISQQVQGRQDQPIVTSSPSSRSSRDAISVASSGRRRAAAVQPSCQELSKENVSQPSQEFQLPPECPLSLLNARTRLPRLDELSRERLIDLVERCSPTLPDGSEIVFDNPLLSLSSLQGYLDLFFTRFNTSYPLIHLATFEPNEVEPILLLTILLLGATYADKSAHQLAVCIHDVLRPQIFANPGFSAKPDLWVLQSILLTECLGKSRAGQKQHDMSHLFHGMLINLIRRSDCQTAQPDMSVKNNDQDLDKLWKDWAGLEQKKRLAQICFVMDVEHAVLFSQSLCMSAFELRTALPCSQVLWEANSAENWRLTLQQKSNRPPPLLLAVLKTYLTPTDASKRIHLDSLSRTIILHALMSISWDMNRRDQTSLGVIGGGGDAGDGTWQNRISQSYNVWKQDLDSFCANMLTTTTRTTRRRRRDHLLPDADDDDDDDVECCMMKQQQQQQQQYASYQNFAIAYNSLYHAAQITLLAEILDLQIYAGARHILGRPVTRPDYTRSQRVVKKWANETPLKAAQAAWHAAFILYEANFSPLPSFSSSSSEVPSEGKGEGKEREGNGTIVDSFHHPWVLFLATLTIWSFYHARPRGACGVRKDSRGETDDVGEDGEMEEEEEDEEEIIWDAKIHMHQLLDYMIRSEPGELLNFSSVTGRRNCTAGLTAIVVGQLSKIRWGVVHDGMVILKGLVPWRLINESGST